MFGFAHVALMCPGGRRTENRRRKTARGCRDGAAPQGRPAASACSLTRNGPVRNPFSGRATAERAADVSPPVLDTAAGEAAGRQRVGTPPSCRPLGARPGVEVHDENAGDREDSPRSLRIVRTRHRRQRVPVGGALTCAERARGAKLEGGTWKRDVSRTGDASQPSPGRDDERPPS